MKILISLSFALLLGWGAVAQTDFARADSIAAAFAGTYTDAADLARQLAQPFDTDVEKARVLFMWVAHHVRYDVGKYQNPPPRPNFTGKTEAEMLENRREWKEKELRKTLKGKKGVCQDYSELYQVMCAAVGLECELVVGDARDFFKPYRNVHDNPHAWNAVKIGGQWQLLDATWAAGYVRNGNFTRKVAPGYFMAPPAWFAQSHLPDKAEWQLLEPPLDKKDFPDQPLVNFGQQDYPLLDFSQKLERTADGLAQLRFKFSAVPKAFMVTAGKSGKPVKFSQAMEDGWAVLRFSSKGLGDVTVFMGESQRSRMGWLAKYDIK